MKICGTTCAGINEKENTYTHATTGNNIRCWHCEKNNNIEVCKRLCELSYNENIERLKEFRLYFCCLNKF